MSDFDTYFPLRRSGLRRNPFGTLSADEWADIALIPAAVEAALDSSDHILFLGQRGRGKSTLLRALCRQLAWQGQAIAYEGIPEGTHRYQTDISALDSFALDETQRLALWQWWGLLNRARAGMRLYIASHRNESWLFKFWGLPVRLFRLPDLIDRKHSAAVLRKRLQYFALEGVERPHFADDALTYLWGEFRDDLRGQDTFLYEYFQQLDKSGAITAEHLARFQRLQNQRQ